MIPEIERLPDITFIDGVTLDTIKERLVSDYEEKFHEETGTTVNLKDGEPISLMLYACAVQFMQMYENLDKAGKMNFLKYTYGDFLDNIGLNAAALLPVAILRRTLIEAIFGPEPFEQEENITVKKYGLAKVSLAIFIITAIFLLIYNIADCAGTRPFIFILAKVCLSLLASYSLSLLAINLLSYDDRR